uniref:Solute carrier family 22 member 18 n=1 Tax=Ursus maritimus TaxID=29073 RepID=A0A452TJK0_URSMA
MGQRQHSGGMGTLGRPRVILLTYVLFALELTCLFMRFSIMPYLTRQLGLDSVAFGYLQTAFGVLQLLGGPVFGRFADQRGARAAFTLNFLASSAFYLLLAAACSPALPAVLSGGERSVAEGAPGGDAKCGAHTQGPTSCVTTTVTPRLRCPAFVALVAHLVAPPLSSPFIPSSTKGATGSRCPPGGTQASVFDLKAISRVLLQPGVLPVFLVKVVSGFPSGLFMVMFSIISMDFFQLDAAQAGYLTSFFGVLQMVIQGLVIGRLSSHFSEGALLRASTLVFIVVGLAMALMSNVFHFCLLMPGLVFGLCALNVVTDSMLTKAVSASDTGTMLGLCASVQPLTRTLGPTVGGLLYRSFGVPVFGHVQFATNILVLLVLWRQPLPQKTDKVW